MAKHLIEQISKSVQFPSNDNAEMEVLAKELGYTRHKDGVETADISKLVRRAVRFMLDNVKDFKEWQVSGGKKSSRKN